MKGELCKLATSAWTIKYKISRIATKITFKKKIHSGCH